MTEPHVNDTSHDFGSVLTLSADALKQATAATIMIQQHQKYAEERDRKAQEEHVSLRREISTLRTEMQNGFKELGDAIDKVTGDGHKTWMWAMAGVICFLLGILGYMLTNDLPWRERQDAVVQQDVKSETAYV